jgi:hypothetical protein
MRLLLWHGEREGVISKPAQCPSRTGRQRLRGGVLNGLLTGRVVAARLADRLGGADGAALVALRLGLLAVRGAREVAPAVAGLAGGAEVDVDEAAVRIDADAHAAGVEALGEVVDLAGRDALDADVHGGGVEVAAGVALGEAEAGDEGDALLAEVIVDAREHLVELGADGAGLVGALAAEELVELGE